MAAQTIVRLLRDCAWRYRYCYLAGFLFLWLTNYLKVSIPGEIGQAVDALAGHAPVGGHVATIAAMGVAIIIVRTLSRILVFNPARYLEYHLREDLFAKLMSLPPSFYAQQRRGDLVSRAVNDLGWVRGMVGFGGLQTVNVGVALVLTIWKMLELSPRLTLLVMLPVAVAMVVVYWSVRRLFALGRRSQEELGRISEQVLSSLQGIASIKGFVAENAFIARFEHHNNRWLTTGMKVALMRSLALPLLALAGGVGLFMLISIGGLMVLQARVTVGELTAFTVLLSLLLPPLQSLGFLLSVVQQGRAGLDRIGELLGAPVQRPEGENGVKLCAGRGPSLELCQLSFAYPDDPQTAVLKDLTMTIPSGSLVGLFGRTGSGKSTLLHLLARLHTPPPGSILVDGVDITALDLESWRQRLAVVPQRPFLFSDSVSFNVALSQEPEQDKVREAVRLAAMDKDVQQLPRGLETVVGERGIMLSGGQRQRVTLARALMVDADVVLVDDVLSGVDQTTEAALVETLTGLGGRGTSPTVIIASHRLSALRSADHILVLDHGEQVDLGSHEELLVRCPLYRETWQAQLAGTSSDGRRRHGQAPS